MNDTPLHNRSVEDLLSPFLKTGYSIHGNEEITVDTLALISSDTCIHQLFDYINNPDIQIIYGKTGTVI